ncbi:aromatic acid exporter family protein [Alteribacillus sp. HJP-4]|uniref:FUSC family protein n=1 Tax=Alteribacillus sp. HJP-4 TaxID=2775394 RepID=UPI0035CD2DCD
MKKNRFKFLGGRIVKTGIAVFLTALICQQADLPVAFAVITAIVTLEPTAADSIKKGMQRFPASLIGAGLAVTSVYFLGHNAMAYAVATVFTIYICHLLRLEAGMLVATLTAVAMMPGTNEAFLLAFLERAGTTTIGLVISTLVNLTIIPPHFSEMIASRNKQFFLHTADVLEKRSRELFTKDEQISKTSKQEYRSCSEK